ncbi:hypothetical protein AB4097_08650 [Microvirga sp. 2MCAF35]|uniref:hypothetical protein n=1 Tax=Microvirga sp. 2MCAF35 TaxID=3232987 RepID=UPI003F9AAC86
MGNAGYGNHTEDTQKDVASPKQAPQSGSDKPSGCKIPAAGPHDKPHLTNPDATPGAGSLPEAGDHDATDSTSS